MSYGEFRDLVCMSPVLVAGVRGNDIPIFFLYSFRKMYLRSPAWPWEKGALLASRVEE